MIKELDGAAVGGEEDALSLTAREKLDMHLQ
jgi:hypothetical protein